MENQSENQDYNQAILRYNWDNLVFLIAEDIEMNYLFLAEALKKTGVTVLWAVNGLQAVEICQTTEKIDMLITDIQMPEMDGFAATKKISQIRPELPIIGYTAYSYSGTGYLQFLISLTLTISIPLPIRIMPSSNPVILPSRRIAFRANRL